MSEARKQMQHAAIKAIEDEWLFLGGLDEVVDLGYTYLNQLGLHDEMQAYIKARDTLESKLRQLYEVFYTAQAEAQAKAKG